VAVPDATQIASVLAESTQAVRKYAFEKRRVPKTLDELVASGYPLESKLEVRDARSGTLLASWPSSVAGNMAFSRDGKRLLVTAGRLDVGYGFGQPSAELWDFESGRRILTLKGHSEPFHSVVFAANDRRIVSTAFDMTVRQWESFPWREAEYPGSRRESFLDRARRLADDYWRTRLAAEARPVQVIHARPDNAAIWPKRDPAATSAQLDLTHHYNGLLRYAAHPVFLMSDFDNGLRDLGPGLLELGSIRFDVRGVIQLRRQTDLEGPFLRAWERLPTQVERIPVQQQIRRLHVLHGTVFGNRAARERSEGSSGAASSLHSMIVTGLRPSVITNDVNTGLSRRPRFM
jgi:hypothetical protein